MVVRMHRMKITDTLNASEILFVKIINHHIHKPTEMSLPAKKFKGDLICHILSHINTIISIKTDHSNLSSAKEMKYAICQALDVLLSVDIYLQDEHL